MNIIERPQLNGRRTVETETECPTCKASGNKTLGGYAPRLRQLAETDAETAAQLAKIGMTVKPIADSERGLFCLHH
jgi:hypothetical protein